MSIWTRITEALAALTGGEGLAALLDRRRASPDKSVAFTIAVIALGAKMAKADGQVTRDEVSAFRQVFFIPKGEEASAARVFNLARQDVLGFEGYAVRIAALFRGDRQVLIDLMEGLFYIALADGNYHPGEDLFLARIAEIFALDGRCFNSLKVRFVVGGAPDPYAVLGVEPEAGIADLRLAWRQAVLAAHPDGMRARGVPAEALKLAEQRLVAINAAWAEINRRRAA